MKIINQTNKITLTDDACEAKSFSDRTLGLLKPTKPRSLLLHTRFGIHTFGMKDIIDVLILDQHNTVVSHKKNLKPNRIFLWNPKYSTVIELPSGTLHASHSKLGDKIEVSRNT